jgi:mRNA-degrading endonuclease RelE of RelBE toxin-antitoxin system
MIHREPYRLSYDSDIPRQLRSIERKYHLLIRTKIEEQLTYEPNVETTNRKPLERPVRFNARWELRFGPNNRFRVYYRIEESEHEVYILVIGLKIRDKVYIGGEEYEL